MSQAKQRDDHRVCPRCLDQRRCWVCEGRGVLDDADSDGTRPCTSCGGRALCPLCHPARLQQYVRAQDAVVAAYDAARAVRYAPDSPEMVLLAEAEAHSAQFVNPNPAPLEPGDRRRTAAPP